MKRRFTVPIKLARRFSRSRQTRKSTVALGAISALLMVVYGSLSSLALSGTQVAERELGRFTASTQLTGHSVRDSTATVDKALETLKLAGASEAVAILDTFDVTVRGIADVVAFREAAWLTEPFPSRYVLKSGRWPERPGEVTVSPSLQTFTKNDSISAMSNNVAFNVVGVVTDRYSEHAFEILASPSTWALLDWQELRSRYPSAEATATLLWSGIELEAGLDALRGRIESRSGSGSVDRGISVGPATSNELSAIVQSVRGNPVDVYPLAFDLPALVLVPLGVFGAVATNERRLRKNARVLRSVGFSDHDSVTGVLFGTGVWVLVSTVAGIVLGALLAWVARPLVAAASSQPLSAYPSPLEPAGRIALAALVAFLVLLTVVRRRTRLSANSVVRAGRKIATPLRQVLLAISAVILFWQILGIVDLFDATLAVASMTIVVALLVPDIVRLALAAAPQRGPVRRLAVRQLQSEKGRAVAVICLIVVTVGPALAMLTLLHSVQVSYSAQRQSPAPAGQVMITTSSSVVAPPPEVVQIAANQAGPDARRVELYGLASAFHVAGDQGRFVGFGWG